MCSLRRMGDSLGRDEARRRKGRQVTRGEVVRTGAPSAMRRPAGRFGPSARTARRSRALHLGQVKGPMRHPAYQVVASVRLKVPWVSHGEQYTIDSVTPPLLLHQWGLTLARPRAPPSGNASGSPAAAAARSAAKRQPDGDGQQEHVADDGGDHAAGGRAAEAAARDVESAHGRLREGDDEHDEHRGDRRRGEFRTVVDCHSRMSETESVAFVGRPMMS